MEAPRFQESTLGTFVKDVFWSCELPVAGLGDRVELNIDNGESVPTEQQLATAREIVAGFRTVRADIEKALYQYYLRVQPEYRAFLGEEFADTLMPIIADASQIWALLRHPGIFVPDRTDIAVCTISWSTTWDDRGVSVLLRQMRVVTVDTDSTSIFDEA